MKGQDIVNDTISEEAAHLRKLWQQEQKRRIEAEEALKFYASPSNYRLFRPEPGKHYQGKVVNDYSSSDNLEDTLVAGRRAREHFKNYETD